MPTVSVIITSYNHALYIAEAIESILGQTFSDLELIVIDDASSDHSREIIERYQRADTRIRAFFHDENLGISASMNHGLDRVRGDYMAVCASDDAFMADKLERQLAILKDRPHTIAVADGIEIDAQGRVQKQRLFCDWVDGLPRHGDIFEDLLRHGANYIYPQTMLVRMEDVGDRRLHAELKYLNEYQFMVDLASRCTFYNMHEPVFKRRVHGKNLTQVWDEDLMHREMIMMCKYNLEFYRDRLSPRTQKCLCFAIVRYAKNRNKMDDVGTFTQQAVLNDPAWRTLMERQRREGYVPENLGITFGQQGEITFSFRREQSADAASAAERREYRGQWLWDEMTVAGEVAV